MKRLLVLSAVVACALVVAATTAVFEHEPEPVAQLRSMAEPAEAPRVSAKRKFAALLAAPERSPQDSEALLLQSDSIRAQLEEQGEVDVGAAMRTRLREVEVEEDDARAWFEEHRETFGARSFAQSRQAIERLIAIEQVRAEFDLEAP